MSVGPPLAPRSAAEGDASIASVALDLATTLDMPRARTVETMRLRMNALSSTTRIAMLSHFNFSIKVSEPLYLSVLESGCSSLIGRAFSPTSGDVSSNV